MHQCQLIPMRAGRTAGAILLLLSLFACAPRGTEDVIAHVVGSHLVIENHSGTDVHMQLVAGRGAWIPVSMDGNRLADGATQKFRIAPSQRGQSIQVVWWRPGDKIDGSELRGADRLRRLPVELAEPPEPWPEDEALVRVCIDLAGTMAREYRERPGGVAADFARNYEPAKAEQTCMQEAEAWCPTGTCARRLAEQQAALVRVTAALEQHRAAAAAATPAPGPASGQLEVIAKEAFFDLRDGKVDRYRTSLCPAQREAVADPAAQMTLVERGQAWARRRVDLMAVAEEGPMHVTFGAADEATLTGQAPALPGLRFRATFARDGDRYCVMDIAELK